MTQYYLNKHQQPNGDFEVHRYGCAYGAEEENQIYLGEFQDCSQAVLCAKLRFSGIADNIDGCYYCCNPCHRH